jgi:hypothetical protein
MYIRIVITVCYVLIALLSFGQPKVLSRWPANGDYLESKAINGLTATLDFDKPITKGTGSIDLYYYLPHARLLESVPVTDVIISGNRASIPFSKVFSGSGYSIDVPSTAFKDENNNYFAGFGSSGWSFCACQYPLPQVNSINPSQAKEGDEVTIIGNYLKKVYRVSFGGVDASSFTLVGSTMIKAIVGPGATGSLKIYHETGSVETGNFSFRAEPSVDSFSPSQAGEGDEVTIIGRYFENVSRVSFGGVDASSFTVLGSTMIKAIVGPGATGPLKIYNEVGSVETGDFSFMVPLAIEKEKPSSLADIFPNPSNGSQVIIAFDDRYGTEPVTIYMTDLTSRTIKTFTVMPRPFVTLDLDLANQLTPGLYLLKIHAKGKTSTKKLFVK